MIFTFLKHTFFYICEALRCREDLKITNNLRILLQVEDKIIEHEWVYEMNDLRINYLNQNWGYYQAVARFVKPINKRKFFESQTLFKTLIKVENNANELFTSSDSKARYKAKVLTLIGKFMLRIFQVTNPSTKRLDNLRVDIYLLLSVLKGSDTPTAEQTILEASLSYLYHIILNEGGRFVPDQAFKVKELLRLDYKSTSEYARMLVSLNRFLLEFNLLEGQISGSEHI